MKQLTRYPLTTNTEVNLPTVLIVCELLIHHIIKENEAGNKKLFAIYSLTTNTEVSLHAVLMVCELLIHHTIKENET